MESDVEQLQDRIFLEEIAQEEFDRWFEREHDATDPAYWLNEAAEYRAMARCHTDWHRGYFIRRARIALAEAKRLREADPGRLP